MKSATYILKKPHLEKLQNEEYSQHVERIQKIATSKIDVSKVTNLPLTYCRNIMMFTDCYKWGIKIVSKTPISQKKSSSYSVKKKIAVCRLDVVAKKGSLAKTQISPLRMTISTSNAPMSRRNKNASIRKTKCSLVAS